MGLGLVERGRAPGRKAPKDIMHKMYIINQKNLHDINTTRVKSNYNL